MRKKGRRIGAVVALLLLFALLRPTWTPAAGGGNSVSELRRVAVGGTELAVMIRGSDRDNPVVLFVHGGPCCPETPYVRKYQRGLERDFTVVHYDQRGCGKSYAFGEDYAELSAAVHVGDLLRLTEYIEEYLGAERVILVGHSYGTYIAAQAAARRPELYRAYVGVGQVSDPAAGERDNLEKCIEAAQSAGNEADAAYLRSLEPAVAGGEIIAPRAYARKYGLAARGIDESADCLRGLLLGTEYNLSDTVRYAAGALRFQEKLLRETAERPLPQLVTGLDLPVYFLMGRYDAMTSPRAAAAYLAELTGEGEREFVLFEDSAHFPQFEEAGRFARWMKDSFGA